MIELDFICDVCGGRVADGAGCILVRYADIATWRRLDSEWHAAFPGDTGNTLPAIMARPGTVPWRIHHDVCSPDDEGYDINVAEVRTWRGLCAWTGRLMGKSWLPLTDWRHLIDYAARGQGERIVPAEVQGDAA